MKIFGKPGNSPAPVFLIFLFFQFFLFLTGNVCAQAALRLELSQTNYIQYEPVYVMVSIRNYTAHSLVFGEAPGLKGKLDFEIETPDGRRSMAKLLDPKKPAPLTGTIIPPGGTRHLTFCLSAYYDLRQKGRYSIRAVLSHPQFQQEYESEAAYMSVVSGMPVWTTTVGIPDLLNSSAGQNPQEKKIQTRKYSIVSYFTGKTSVYALVIEDSSRVYAVRRIAFDMGGNLKPKCEIDYLSRINLLVSASPKVYVYYQYDPNGNLIKKQILIKTSTTPSLIVNHKTGSVMVAGGREARKDVDYEEIKDLPFFENVNPDMDAAFGPEDDDEDFGDEDDSSEDLSAKAK